MSRFFGVFSVLVVVLLAVAFAASNAGHYVTLDLGILTLYRAPVTLVAFGGLLVGMLVMFSTGIYTDLKVRKILRDRLAEEAKREQGWIDGNQQDLFTRTEEVQEEEEGLKAPLAMETPQPAEPLSGAETQPSPTDPFPDSRDDGLPRDGVEPPSGPTDQEETRTE